MSNIIISNNYKHKDNCRICGSKNLSKVLELGPMPLANKFLNSKDIISPEHFYPLDIHFCNSCGLTQLTTIVDKEEMFEEYPYFSSVSKTFVKHSEDLAKEVIDRFIDDEYSLVVEIGSNDGVLLKPLIRQGISVQGVEPAKNVAKVAQASGVDTIIDYFTENIAKLIIEKKGKAHVVFACNAFNHIDNLDTVMKGIYLILDDEGVFILEVPYIVDLLQNKSFDTMYHEMHSYFSVRPLVKLFEIYGMEIFDVNRFGLHTGSIRVYVKKTKSSRKINKSLKDILIFENKIGLDKKETYLNFSSELMKIKENFLKMIKKIKNEGNRIVGYGAPAKGNVLLNYFGIGTDIIDYIVDATPYKQGLYTPGMHIPVFPVEKFNKEKPDFALLLPWNFSEEILMKEKRFRDDGGKFIIPLPNPKIV